MEDKLSQAFNELLQLVFGGNVPEDHIYYKVHGATFDKYRREVERKYELHKDDDLYVSWLSLLMLQSPDFYTDEELSA